MHFMIVLTALLGIASFIYSTFISIRGIRYLRDMRLRSEGIDLILCAVLGYYVAFYAGNTVWLIVFK